jgi:1,3-beta-glucanosyltransferase GAS3
MLSFKSVASTLIALGALLQPSQALLPLTIKGNRFIQPSIDSDDGSVFFINGVDYQIGGSSDYTYNMTSDVLTDAQVCARDATALQNLGVNTIRIYTIDPDLNHDECMSIFNSAGIYVILDVNSPLGGESLNRFDPESTYNAWYMSRVFKVIESFRTYSNVIGFFLGNEVINDEKSAGVDPMYLRAITRDARAYIQNRMKDDNSTASRDIFVGYSAADELSLRMPTFEYLTCEIEDEEVDSSIEFFGLNSYEWCSGVSNWESSGYSKLVTGFNESSVPVFFSEYGCNKQSPRTFDEVSEGIYGPLIDVLDGGLVYEYAEEPSNYGLVDIDDNTITLYEDYFNFKDQLVKAKIPTINETKVEDNHAPKCNSSLIQAMDSSFNATFDLPQANKDIKWMIDNGESVQHVGKFVNVDKYLNMYASDGSIASGLTTATFVASSGKETSTTALYLTVDSKNLVNDKATKTSSSSAKPTSTSNTNISTSSTSSSATVSSISTASHKNGADHVQVGAVAGFFGILAALI